MKEITKKYGVLVIFGLLTAVIVFYYFHETAKLARADAEAAQNIFLPNPFDHVETQAKNAFILDLRTGQELYRKDAAVSVPLASITKIMTAVVAKNIFPADSTITIMQQDLLTEGESGLYAGERWNLDELIKYMLIVSSNDAAAAIARHCEEALHAKNQVFSVNASFVGMMNDIARKLNLATMHFTNPSGLDETTQTAGAYASAQDTAYLFSHALAIIPDIIESTRHSGDNIISLSGTPHKAANTNVYAETFPGLIASKTGYTDLAGGNLAVASDIGRNHPVIIVVLGSSKEGRFTDVAALHKTVRSYIKITSLFQ